MANVDTFSHFCGDFPQRVASHKVTPQRNTFMLIDSKPKSQYMVGLFNTVQYNTAKSRSSYFCKP